MKTLFKDKEHKLEVAIIDENGGFVSGLTISYDIRNSIGNVYVISGITSEINNLYTLSYVFTENGEYRLKYITPSDYENGFEQIYVVDNYITDISEHRAETETRIKYILGLGQQNFKIVDQVYDINNLLLSSTIKIYDNASDCNNDVSTLKEYNMSATYSVDGQITSYKVIEA